MSQTTDSLTDVAEAFGRNIDPLAEYESTFENLDIDPFDLFLEKVQIPKGSSQSTIDNYQYAFNHWVDFMQDSGRHPACPNDDHVKEFVNYLQNERGNAASTIMMRIEDIQRAYEWWQDHHAFPHPTDYNPFALARREINLNKDLTPMKHPQISVDDLRRVIRGATNIRHRFFLMFQLKLGLRASELLNVKIKEVSIGNNSVKKRYPEMGTASPISDYQNVIYIPSKNERDKNKSHNPRILPLDDELREVLIQYLATRPMMDTPWLVLSQRKYAKIERTDILTDVWKEHFFEYNTSDQYRTITSHYGRHYFSRYWRVQENIPRELVQYMRGDKIGKNNGESIDQYLTAYFEDISELYLNSIFKFL